MAMVSIQVEGLLLAAERNEDGMWFVELTNDPQQHRMMRELLLTDQQLNDTISLMLFGEEVDGADKMYERLGHLYNDFGDLRPIP